MVSIEHSRAKLRQLELKYERTGEITKDERNLYHSIIIWLGAVEVNNDDTTLYSLGYPPKDDAAMH